MNINELNNELVMIINTGWKDYNFEVLNCYTGLQEELKDSLWV